MSDLLPTLTGLALGFGIASVIYLGVFLRSMKRLHIDNLEAAKLVAQHRASGIQKVEEQNMTALSARLDQIEEHVKQTGKVTDGEDRGDL